LRFFAHLITDDSHISCLMIRNLGVYFLAILCPSASILEQDQEVLSSSQIVYIAYILQSVRNAMLEEPIARLGFGTPYWMRRRYTLVTLSFIVVVTHSLVPLVRKSFGVTLCVSLVFTLISAAVLTLKCVFKLNQLLLFFFSDSDFSHSFLCLLITETSKVWKEVAKVTIAFAEDFPSVHTINLGGGFKVRRMEGEGESETDLHQVGLAGIV
jgi:hypothetical protein